MANELVRFKNTINFLYQLSNICHSLQPLYGGAQVPLVLTPSLLQYIETERANNNTKRIQDILFFIYQLLMVYAFQEDFDNIGSQHLFDTVLLKSFESPNETQGSAELLSELFNLVEFMPFVTDVYVKEPIELVNPEGRKFNLPPQVEPQNSPVYRVPTTLGAHTANNCFLNSVLMALFMFPSNYIVEQLYMTVPQRTHYLDPNKNMCLQLHLDDNMFDNADFVEDIKTVRDNAIIFRNSILNNVGNMPVTLRLQQYIEYNVQFDYDRRLLSISAFRFFYEALQKRTDPNTARDTIRHQMMSCPTMMVEEVVTRQSFGNESDVMFFFERMFSPPHNTIRVRSDYSAPDGRTCTSYADLETSSVITLNPEENASNTLWNFYVQNSLKVSKSKSFEYTCDGQVYSNLTQSLVGLRGTFFAVHVSRKAYRIMNGVGFQDVTFSTSITPDEFIDTLDDTRLTLLSILVNQSNVHYVCYVRNTHTNQWMFFDSGSLTVIEQAGDAPAGSYEAMLRRTQFVPGELQPQSAVQRCGTLYIYGTPFATEQ